MQKPLDPLSVERVRTLPASYVLRRRYGPARHVIAVASWVTVINMLLQPVAVLAATQYWDTSTTANHQGGNGTWDTSGATYWGDLPGTAALVNWTTSNDAVLDADTATVVTLGGNNITAGVIQIGNSNFTIAQNASADRTLTYTQIESSAGSGTQTLTLSAASGRTLTLGSPIQNGGSGGTIALTKTGAGTLVLSGANSYSGLTTISTGTLVVGGSNTTGTGGTTLADGGTLQFDGSTSNPLASGTLVLNAGTVQALNAGHVINNTTTIDAQTTPCTFSGDYAMEFSGPVTIDGGGTENFTSSITDGNTLTFSNTVQFGVATGRTVTLAGTGNTTFSGPITQPAAGASLTITNTGTTTLSNANTYTGTTTVKAGTLRLSHATALPGGIGATGGTSALKLDGGVVELGNATSSVISAPAPPSSNSAQPPAVAALALTVPTARSTSTMPTPP